MRTLMTLATAAGRLGLAPDTVKKYADEGRLACYVLPGGARRFTDEDIDAFVAALRKPVVVGATP